MKLRAAKVTDLQYYKALAKFEEAVNNLIIKEDWVNFLKLRPSYEILLLQCTWERLKISRSILECYYLKYTGLEDD